MDPRAVEWAAFRHHYPRCADCSREVARLGTLIAALRLEAFGGSAHLTDRQLLAGAGTGFNGSNGSNLRREERERIEQHLTGCAPCRTELALLERFDFAALAPDAVLPSPAARLLDALRRLGAALVPPLRRPVIAAGALIVILAVPAIFVWRALSERAAEEPVLARSETEPTAPPVPPMKKPEAAEVKAPPAPIEAPPAPERTPAEARPAAPLPAGSARPVEQKARPAPAAAEKAPTAPAAAEKARPEAPAEKSEPELARPVQIAALLPPEAPRYAPAAVPPGATVRIGGESRSVGVDAPAPQVLAPEHVGRTARESPTLYWFLPRATALPVEVTVVDPNGVEPLLETALSGPVPAGVHAVRLADHGVELAPGVDHPWFVSVVVDPAQRSSDVVSGAVVRYEPLAREPAARLAATAPARLAHAYADAGLWYDAFDQLSTWLAAEPGAGVLREYRAALLEQVGLDAAARVERGSAPATE